MNPDSSAPQEFRAPGRPPSSNRNRFPRKVRGDGRAVREQPRRDWKPEPGTPQSGPVEDPGKFQEPGSPGPDRSPELEGSQASQEVGNRNSESAPDSGDGMGPDGRPRKEPFWMRFRRKRLERRAAAEAPGGQPAPMPEGSIGAPVPDTFQPPQDSRPRRSDSRPPRNDRPNFRSPRPDARQDHRPQGRPEFQRRDSNPYQDRDRRAPERRPEAPRDLDRDGPPPSQMTPLQLAARIVDRSSDENPADMVLRQTLYRRRGLSPADSAWISRAVFSFFRWQRWLNPERPLEDRVTDALSLANRFAQDPTAFSDAELIANVGPDWVGQHLTVTPELARAIQREPALWLRCRPQFTEETAHLLRDVEPGPLPDSLRYFGHQDLFLDRGFQAGTFEIQDLASQAVGLVCNPRPNEIWWDACAGEGGKTLHLSSIMGGKSLVWASDRAAWRLDRLRQRAGRAKCFNYRVVDWDGGETPPTKTRFDGILVDAPCSGLGTWGRNPHSRWTTTEQDVLELAAIQKRLLMNVADSLKPGGKLIYSACTLTHAETSEVADWFTNERPEFETLAMMNPFLPDDPPVTQMHLWPQDTGGNGMFMAAWRKE